MHKSGVHAVAHVYEDYDSRDESALWMTIKRKSGLVFLRGVIWGIAGGFFGIVFLAVLRHLQQAGDAAWQVVLAAAVAGSVVGAFYSAKRVAIIGAAAGSVASTAYLIAVSTPESPWPVFGVCAAAGFAVGAGASAIYERRRGALLVALAGLAAGAVAGVTAAVVGTLTGTLDQVFVLALVLAPVTGALFTAATLMLAERFAVPVPQWLSIAVVSAEVAGVVGSGLWVLSVPLAHGIDPALQAAIQEMLGQLPRAFLGGLLGGAIAGVALELLNVPWTHKLPTAGEGGPLI
jgi:hypothetical protein